jgi:hypothetical protein
MFSQLKSKTLDQMLGRLGLKRPSPNRCEIDNAMSGSKDSESKLKGEDVFVEFQRATILMSLLAAINSEGRQVLDSEKYQADHNFDTILASLEWMQPTDRLVSTALSMLLVRNNKVVAVTTVADLEPRIVDPQGILPPDTNLHDLAMRESSPPPEADLARPGLVDFIAVRNPEWDKESKKSSGLSAKIWKENLRAQYMVLPKGTSHWEAVSKDPWGHKYVWPSGI